MQLTAILLLACGLQIAVAGRGQTITFSGKEVPLEKVFAEVKKQTGFTVVSSARILDMKPVCVNAKQTPLLAFLKQLFDDQPVELVVESNSIFIRPSFPAQWPNAPGIQPLQIASAPADIHGQVKDEKGQPLQGATILIKGTKNGVKSDANGNFSIAADPAATLVITFVGYEQTELAIAGRNNIAVQLRPSAAMGEQIVVVGYGTQRKGELTGAVSSVKAEDFVKGSISDVAQLLTGKIAGLGIVKPDADPLRQSQITLRGITSLKAGSEPLVIIDGIPGLLSSVAPMDIESIDVLKDGSAAAIYGTRGSNGVILITTQKINRVMPVTVDVRSTISVQRILKKLDFMSAEDYRKLVAQGKPGAIDNGGSTNWLDEITQTPVSSIYNVTMKAGNAGSNYIINVNYQRLQGLIQRSDNNVLIPRLEVNQSLFKGKIKLNGTMMGREQKYFSGLGIDVYRNALGYNPTDPVKDENGVWTEHPGINNYANPVALLKETTGQTISNTLRTFGSITYLPFDNLFVRMNVSHSTNNFMNGYSETKKHISTIRDSRNGVASRESRKTVDDFIEMYAQYKKVFSKHNITALLGQSWQNSQFERFYMYNFDFPSDQYSYNNMATGQALQRGEAQMTSYRQETSLVGYFTRLNYSYDNRYLLMASLRHEGSSKFGRDFKWGNFPAVSAGWNMKNESFMSGIAAFSTLKLRAGFGVTGTEPTDPYMSQSRLGYGPSYLLNGVWTPVILPLTNSNPSLRWERKEELNVGLDFGLLKDRITGTIDLYKRTTKGLLWDYNVPMPPYLYPTITANAGVMQNKGIEVQLRTVPFMSANFQWTSTVNFSTNRNKLLSLSGDKFVVQGGFFNTGYIGEPIQETTHRVEQGREIGNFWAYQSVDIDENGYWIILGKDGKPKPVAQASPDDQRVVGNGLPKHYASWNNTFRYKQFDLDVNMRGAFGFDIINYSRIFYETPVNLARGNILKSTYNNVYGKRPLNDLSDYKFVSNYVEKGDYWKIDNITLGYNLAHSNTFVKQLRVFLSAQNLLVITKYSGIDPEVNINGLAPGADDRDRYPSTRSFALGVNVTF